MKKKIVLSDYNGSARKVARLIELIKINEPLLAEKKVTTGFDGFIDTIVKIIKNKPDHQPVEVFDTIKEFGNYIVRKEGTSLSLELEELHIKLGGNMPNMSNVFGKLGVSVNCIGALGYPQTHEVFKKLPSNCHLYSFADPGISTAFEFNDGKIMLAQMGLLHSIGWETMKSRIGIHTLINLYKESDLLCMVNWGELDVTGDIWKGLMQEVFPNYVSRHEKQIAFFDLSDCSKRSKPAIAEALLQITEFARHMRVVLSLNKNEARQIYQVLFDDGKEASLTCLGEKMYEKLKVEILLLHAAQEAIAINPEGIFSCSTFFISNPQISTGAGDHFNTGFSVAQLLKLDLESSVIFANAVSGVYVRTGVSPKLTDVIDFLQAVIHELKLTQP